MNEVLWSPGMTLEQLEHQVISKAYLFYRKNKTATANSLGISIRALDSKLEKIESNESKNKNAFEARKVEREEQLLRSRGFAVVNK